MAKYLYQAVEAAKNKPEIEVDFHGLTLCVPEWVEYIACDHNGEVYAFQYQPIILHGDDCWTGSGKTPVKLFEFGTMIVDWRNSEVKL